ncbi:hypothetical protein QA612_17950 [Evansella sp. AB-P1]|uniref:hypothetical protein n=1 Tax=Evansella sp. AB-P1 TaxID=3037653 RepID=UPI00241C71B6|nr:hypothetical protein [Evansella sp. AB-P1]MDG5789347.1 hypothetical protein [Evansella sp. AB-P1]
MFIFISIVFAIVALYYFMKCRKLHSTILFLENELKKANQQKRNETEEVTKAESEEKSFESPHNTIDKASKVESNYNSLDFNQLAKDFKVMTEMQLDHHPYIGKTFDFEGAVYSVSSQTGVPMPYIQTSSVKTNQGSSVTVFFEFDNFEGNNEVLNYLLSLNKGNKVNFKGKVVSVSKVSGSIKVKVID